jgi:hypothetical protein
VDESRNAFDEEMEKQIEKKIEQEIEKRVTEGVPVAIAIAIILVTVANLIIITSFHEYIAWYAREPDGGFTRLPVLTDAYFDWLPIPVFASILAIVAYSVMIIYDRYWFRTIAQVVVQIVGVAVVVSLLSIFPFDFSVIPNATAADVAPTVLTLFLIFMAVVYGVSALVLFVRLVVRYAVKGS